MFKTYVPYVSMCLCVKKESYVFLMSTDPAGLISE
jgi:hypothetical protein